MILHNNWELTNYIIKGDLRIDGVASRLAPEVYLMEENSELFAIHGLDFKSPHHIVIEGWPSSEFWLEILNLLGIQDEVSFCCYIDRISKSEIIRKNSLQFNDLLKSFGYSPSRFDDITYIASLKGYKRALFVEKKIPVKLIRLLDFSGDSGWEELARYLLLKEVNGNIGKEIISAWIDLKLESRARVLKQFADIVQTSSGGKGHIAEELRKIIHDIRFPDIAALLSRFETERLKLPQNIKVDFDKKFEKNLLKICTEVERTDQVGNFISSMNNQNTISILEHLIKLINLT